MDSTPIVDAQIHCFERNHPGRPWTGPGSALKEATGAQVIEWMDATGVDQAVLVSPWLNYLGDSGYAFQIAESYPGRFSVVAPVDLSKRHPEQVLDDVASHRYGGGLRHVLWSAEARTAMSDGTLDPLFSRMEHRGIPLCLALGTGVQEVERVAEKFPALIVVIDHLGLPSTSTPPPPETPFGELNGTLALSAYPNVHVKMTGMPALSREPFPYPDLRSPLQRLLDAFGGARLLWGTDWTRVHAFHSYADGVDWIAEAGLNRSDLALVRGLNAERLFFRRAGAV